MGREKERKAGEQTSDGEAPYGSCVEREERRERERQYLFLFHTSYGRFGLLFEKGRCN